MPERPDIQLGLGLVSIGRAWGHAMAPPPPEAEARALLEAAFEMGVKVYDTAPAYGTSERILGAFLRTLSEDQRRTIFVATKFGEHWTGDGTTRVDHSYDALMRSLDRSVEHLRDIDLLQVHKASLAAFEGEDLRWALEGAQAMDIPQIGASVADLAAGRRAVEMGFHWLQLPYNAGNAALEPLLAEAAAKDIRIMTNRPYASGATIAAAPPEAREAAMKDALALVLAAHPGGAILTGTKSAAHLRQSWQLFAELEAARN
jgi:aryl-alcohol dehydrogenase-like predicted oxidoreductase